MRQSLLLFGLLMAGMLGLSLYYAVLINCVHHYQTGRFASHSTEAVLPIGGLLIYSWLGLKFLKWRLVHQHDPNEQG